MSKEKIRTGFIGLGNIGGPMAENLIADAFDLTVYDVFDKAMQPFAEKGAATAASPKQLAQRCEIIGICVRDDKDVDAVLSGDDGLLAGMNPDTLIAIHSTVTQDSLLRWEKEVASKGGKLIDAPITGGAHGARDKNLCYMVGGSQELLERARPVFNSSAQKIVHAGDLGSGMALKLCNNLMTYTEYTAAHEAVKLAEACGLAPEVLYEVGQANGVINDQMHRFITGREGVAASGKPEDMQAFFGPFGALGEKDLDAALETARQKGIELPTTAFVRERIMKVFLKQY